MKLILPDELNSAQQRILDSYREWFPAGAVCINVMLGPKIGDEEWDIRPLILDGGRVVLLRFSRPLSEALLKTYSAEMEGFSALPGCSIRIERRAHLKQFLSIRAYVPQTLADQLELGEIIAGAKNLALASLVIQQVRQLKARNLVHGHLSLSNLVYSGGSLSLLDPLFGALNGSRDRFLAPEVSPDQEVPHTSDLFGLGLILTELLGDGVSSQQREILERLALPAPRQRPFLEEVEEVFNVRNVGPPSSAGRLVRRPGSSDNATLAQSNNASSRKAQNPIHRGEPRSFQKLWLIAVILFGVALLIRYRYPSLYFQIAHRIPILAPDRNAEYESDWESADRMRMLRVARAAVLEHEPSAENTIVKSIMAGANPAGTTAVLMRVALTDLWRKDLSRADQEAVLSLTLAPLVPQGLEGIPPLASLHPAVIMAVAGQMQPNNPSPQLKLLSLSLFTNLADPVGAVFRQLGELGISSAGAPESLALAGIISGNTNPNLFEAFMGGDSSSKGTLARLIILMPIVAQNDAAAVQLLAAIRDRGGELGQVLGWFDIEDLAKWSSIGSIDKLSLLLNKLPKRSFTISQYGDLLTFPLQGVRQGAALMLRERYFKESDTNLLLLLSGEGNRLTREQTIALISALQLEAGKRTPFIAAWFGLRPAPDTVLLLLLARSAQDSSDIFNLEAARYLRHNEWVGSIEILELLAQHQEPLARTLAYARLDPRDSAQKKILQARISKEKDAALLKMVMGKLS